MFGAAMGVFGGRAAGDSGLIPDLTGGFSGIAKQFREHRDNQLQLEADARYQQANTAGGRVSQSYATNLEPNISMSSSYNDAASSPVFPPATQEKAAAVFGTNDQRQASTNGFKQEIKERIISDISSL
jgi:hypothetical protein